MYFTAIKKICDIYDWDGKGELDMFYLGDVVYALGFNITKKFVLDLVKRTSWTRSFLNMTRLSSLYKKLWKFRKAVETITIILVRILFMQNLRECIQLHILHSNRTLQTLWQKRKRNYDVGRIRKCFIKPG